MIDVQRLERGHLQVALHGEHLGDAVGNRRPSGEDHAATAVDALHMGDFQEHVERALRRGLRQSRDARHLRDVEQVLVGMRLIHRQKIYAELLERERVVLAFIGAQLLELRFEPLLFPLQYLHDPRSFLLALLGHRHIQFAHLALEELLLCRARQWNLFKARVGHDDRIPVARGDAAHQRLSLGLLKIILGRHQDVRARIKHEQLGGKLAEHVIGHDEERFSREAKTFHFHRGGGHHKRFSGTNGVCQ